MLNLYCYLLYTYTLGIHIDILYKYIIVGIRILLALILLYLINISQTIFYRRMPIITHSKLTRIGIAVFTRIQLLMHNKCNFLILPNISFLLKLLAALPVLTAIPETTFSNMKILEIIYETYRPSGKYAL